MTKPQPAWKIEQARAQLLEGLRSIVRDYGGRHEGIHQVIAAAEELDRLEALK